VNATQVVNKLLEADEIDPKQFVDAHPMLNIETAFIHHGWAVRGNDEFGKVNSDGDVRWIVGVYEHQGRYNAVFVGEKLFEGEDHFGRSSRWWENFDIDGEIELKPDQTYEDFVLEIEDYLCDKTGPDAPTPNDD
jgi:hypothetical protein